MTTLSATATASAPAPARPVAKRSLRLGRVLRWALVLIVLAAASLFAWRRLHATSAPTVRYQTATIDHGGIDAKVTASGAVSAIVTVQVGSQVSGRILAWYADFSSSVKKGQLIAKIEPSLFKAAVEQARANYTAAKASYDKSLANRVLAERNYARTLALFEQALASRGDLDAAEAAAEAARADVGTADAAMLQSRAALDQAQLNLSYTDIVSPIDGIVISRNIDVGQTVAASFQAPTLFTIAQDLTKMQVDTNVAEGDVGNVHEGMTASFTVDAYPTRTFRGVVRQVRDNATTLQNVVTYDAVLDVDNGDMALRPTMTANVTFVYASRGEAVRIPNAALRFRPDATTVVAMTGPNAAPAPNREKLAADQRIIWTLRGGTAAAHVVRIGISDGMTTEMVEGDLRAGDAVVTEAIPAAKGS